MTKTTKKMQQKNNKTATKKQLDKTNKNKKTKFEEQKGNLLKAKEKIEKRNKAIQIIPDEEINKEKFNNYYQEFKKRKKEILDNKIRILSFFSKNDNEPYYTMYIDNAVKEEDVKKFAEKIKVENTDTYTIKNQVIMKMRVFEVLSRDTKEDIKKTAEENKKVLKIIKGDGENE